MAVSGVEEGSGSVRVKGRRGLSKGSMWSKHRVNVVQAKSRRGSGVGREKKKGELASISKQMSGLSSQEHQNLNFWPTRLRWRGCAWLLHSSTGTGSG